MTMAVLPGRDWDMRWEEEEEEEGGEHHGWSGSLACGGRPGAED